MSIDGSDGPVDVWHYDSIAYTGVVLLNAVELMEGGELEIMNHEKHQALKLLEENQPYKSEIISYEKPGKMILAQGSEILHHVTPVKNDVKRISLVFGYGPANAFQPPKTNLATMQRVDTFHQVADYEFFREKAWQGAHCLKHYVETIPKRYVHKNIQGDHTMDQYGLKWKKVVQNMGQNVYLNRLNKISHT